MTAREWNIFIQQEGELDSVSLHHRAIIDTVEFLLQRLSEEPIPKTVHELSLLFCDDPAIEKLNHQYRGKSCPTDVLSFSQLEGENHGAIPPTLGDLVISIPTTIRQAKEYNTTCHQELCRLLIHGLLHLFGYDHENVPEEEVKRMQKKEDELMSDLENASPKLDLMVQS